MLNWDRRGLALLVALLDLACAREDQRFDASENVAEASLSHPAAGRCYRLRFGTWGAGLDSQWEKRLPQFVYLSDSVGGNDGKQVRIPSLYAKRDSSTPWALAGFWVRNPTGTLRFELEGIAIVIPDTGRRVAGRARQAHVLVDPLPRTDVGAEHVGCPTNSQVTHTGPGSLRGS